LQLRLRISRNNSNAKGAEQNSFTWDNLMKFLMASASVAAMILGTGPVLAADGDMASADQCEDCRTIIVTGASTDYVASSIDTATKTDTPLIDVPQSITVITREQLDDQSHRSIGDVLRYVPGTTVGQGEGNRDQITLRGQNTTADFFLDGVRDDVQYYRGLYNVERVEVLKGPYALIFGRGGGGGIINRVQKTPVANKEFIAGTASINSFGAWQLDADLNAPLNDTVAVRVNGTYEALDNHRDFYEGERFAWNPYLAAQLGENWKLGLSYEYVNDDRVTDRGVPSIATTPGQPNTPITGFDEQFFGVPGANYAELEAHIAKLRVDGQLTDNLKLTSTLLYGDYDKIYVNVYADGPVVGGEVPLNAYSDPTKRENLIGQANLIWDVQTGALQHKILFGVEYGDQKTRNMRLNRVFSGTPLLTDGRARFVLANPVFPSIAFTTPSRDTFSEVEFFSAYAQDQISIGDHFDVVVGLRYDHFEIDGTDFLPAVDRPFARTDDKLSPRLGLIWKPVENASVYASFSRSFLPRAGDQFVSLAILTLALFQLDRTNNTAVDPANPLNALRLPGTRTKGVEVGLTGRILPDWQVSAGYSYQDSYRSDNKLIKLGQVPKHQFSLWNRYDFTETFGAGVGVIHQGSQFAAIRLPAPAASTRLPSFTRVDAALFFNLSEAVQLQANVENLFDTDYFADAHNNNNISPGAPINGRLTVRVKF
jgi:catecholate siderophore receptor